jgi:hypothetical protein
MFLHAGYARWFFFTKWLISAEGKAIEAVARE